MDADKYMDALFDALKKARAAILAKPCAYSVDEEQAVEAIGRGIAVAIGCRAAVKTLNRLGYVDGGGDLWKPPLGKPAAKQDPRQFDAAQAAALRSAIRDYLAELDSNSLESTRRAGLQQQLRALMQAELEMLTATVVVTRAELGDMACESATVVRHAKPQIPAAPDWPDEWRRNGFNHALVVAAKALRYLADNQRPSGGSSDFNSEHLFQLASELEITRETLLDKAPAVQPAAEETDPADAPTRILGKARELIAEAQRAGLVLTIETVPAKPLAMGNYDIVPSVRGDHGSYR